MCGICGIVSFDRSCLVDQDIVSNMSATLKHRGPDESGVFMQGRCGLGHRRLSIIDLENGQQPMTKGNSGETHTIIYNGEIYNYLEIKDELITRGHAFATNSDTEVVLNAYREWGGQCVNKFRGMFAFAVWDEKQGCLFVARDRLGIKPLYYSVNNNSFIFASEVKPLLASGLVKSALDDTVLDSFLTLGYVLSPKTMFKRVLKLMPGHTMVVDKNGRTTVTCYWNSGTFYHVKNLTFHEAKKRLESLLGESIKMRLMSEVDLGVFLSGGLDSSAIVALMSAVSERRIKTFCVGYGTKDEQSELAYARKMSSLFGTDHIEFTLKPYDFLDAIHELVSITEEPLADTAAIPLYQISKQAKPHATVLLSGEGSDELFAGYSLYQRMLRFEKYKPILSFLRFMPNRCLPGDRVKKYLDWMTSGLEKTYRGTSSYLTPRIKMDLYSSDFFEHSKKTGYCSAAFSHLFTKVKNQPPLSQMLYADSKTWLLDDLLLKADKMTMATSVELRVPFLDHKLVEFAASLPTNFKFYKGQGKYILKKVMEKYLPKEIIYRKKMGFSVPTKRWFAGDLLGPAKDIVLSKRILDTGFFQKSYLETMFERHAHGKEDYSRRIFSLLVFYYWLEIYT